MKSISTVASCALVTALTWGCVGSVKHIVTPVPTAAGAAIPARGIVYGLPATRVAVEVPVRLTVTKPGSFAKEVTDFQANVYPTLTPVLQAEIRDLEKQAAAALYEIGIEDPTAAAVQTRRAIKVEKAAFETIAVIDPTQVFIVQIDAKKTEDRKLKLTFDKAGFLTEGSSEGTDRTFDLVTKSIEIVAGLATEALAAGAGDFGFIPPDDLPANPYSKALAQLSQMKTVRTKRLEVLSSMGAINPSAETLKLMLEELDKETARLRAYFWSKKVTTWKARLQYDPMAPPGGVAALGTIRLFDIETEGGKAVGLSGGNAALVRPIPAAFRPPAGCNCAQGPVAIVHALEPSASTAVAGRAWPTASTLGFRYRLPGRVSVSLEVGNEVVGGDVLSIAQAGEVVALPSDPGGKQSKYALELFAESGALKVIDVQSTVATTADVQALGAAGSALLGIEAKRKELEEAELEERSEKALLTAEVELLRLQKEKRELEEALAAPPD